MARADPAVFDGADPVVDLLLSGRASTAAEAEAMYLDEHVADIAALVRSDMSDAEFRRHPLIALLLAHGSRGSEDSLA
jgi:hypothetical protein